jgi:succinate dehydrogenase / fumarate reductase cytochrome b subunit
MSILTKIWRSTLGKKYLMAITGGGLLVFVFFHMMGNLQIFLGPKAINHYGEMLKANPEFLWPARLGLLVFAIIHICASVALALENRTTREVGYADKKLVAATLASRTMLITGTIVLCFIVYHLLHFTIGTPNPEFMEFRDEEGRHDVYRMMVLGFSNKWASGFYLLGVGLLCFHLSHGVGAAFQSLGIKSQAYEKRIEIFAQFVAWFLFVGYAAVPLAVLAGLVK